jgi:hypothetical protein
MGYKIWRKDQTGWSLAFDVIYSTKDKADEVIEELNARYHELVKYGELMFYPYRDDIKLSRDGKIIDPTLEQTKRSGFKKYERRQLKLKHIGQRTY